MGFTNLQIKPITSHYGHDAHKHTSYMIGVYAHINDTLDYILISIHTAQHRTKNQDRQ